MENSVTVEIYHSQWMKNGINLASLPTKFHYENKKYFRFVGFWPFSFMGLSAETVGNA
jgi:hypothetical protein